MKTETLLLLCLLVAGLAIPAPPALTTSILEKFPTETSVVVAGWGSPTNAYARDDLFTNATSKGEEQEYSGFGFSLTTETIESVYMNVRYYSYSYFTDMSDDGVFLYERLYDGSTWFEYDYLTSTPFVMWELSGYGDSGWFGDMTPVDVTFNVTNRLETASKLSAVKLRIVSLDSGDGGSDNGVYVDSVSVTVVYSTESDFPLGLVLGGLLGVLVAVIIASTVTIKKRR